MSAQQEETKADDRPSISPMTGGLAAWRVGVKKVERLVQPERASAQDRFGCATDRPARMEVDSKVFLTLRGVTPSQEDGIGLARDKKRTRIDLHRGSVISESVNADLLLQTPEGRIEGKNAYLLVEVNEDQTRVVVVDGTLTFTNDLGRVEVPAGSATTVQRGKAPGAPQEVDAEREVAWGRACDPDNLIPNPGLELDLKDWKDLGRHGVNIAADAAQAHTGRRSVCIRFEHCKGLGTYSAVFATRQMMKVVPGRSYLFRVWYKTEGLVISDERYSIQVSVAGEDGCGGKNLWCPSDESKPSWRCARMIFTPSVDRVGVYPAFTEKTPVEYDGEVRFDDFYLGELPALQEPPQGK